MKQYFGNYLGLVVNTEDPEKRGRVQIFIPGMMPTLYGDWDQTKKNISFKTFESETFSAGLNFRLKSLLPWAEAAIPFWGGSTGAPINESTGAPTPMPTDQNFDYSNYDFGDGQVVGLIGPKDNLSSGAHLDLRWGDANSSSSANYVPNLSEISKYISIDGKPLTNYRITNDAQDHINRGSSPAWDLADPSGPGIIAGKPIVLYNGARIINSGSFSSDRNSGWIEVAIPNYTKTVKLLHLSYGSISGGIKNQPNSNPPPEAYADTRIADTSGLARSDGDPNGDYVKVGNGLSDAALSSVRSGMGLGSTQLANNAAVAYQTAYNQSIANGATPQQASIVASAIVGNIARESGFRTGLSHDGGIGYGLLGENQDILQRMLTYAGNKGENRQTGISVQTQIEALFREPYFIGSRARNGGFEGLKNSADVSSAAELFTKGYLLPAAKTANYQERINNAIAANQTFSSLGAGELVSAVEGQNVLRTRVPDQYGSIDGNRTGAPMGFTSIPFVGSKVWVFFNGGDIQRPVYFAATYETQNIV